jgi:hypothetical protein
MSEQPRSAFRFELQRDHSRVVGNPYLIGFVRVARHSGGTKLAQPFTASQRWSQLIMRTAFQLAVF